MKKILRTMAVLLACALPLGAHAQSSSVTIYINGQRQHFDQPPVTQSGRVFVPMRGVFQTLGASVVYANRQVNATGRGKTVSLTLGSQRAIVDGQIQYLDVAPFLAGARTMIPLRFVAQALGAAVNWNQTTNAVTIYTNSGQRPSPPRTSVYFLYNRPTGPINAHTAFVQFALSSPTARRSLTVRVDGDIVEYVQQHDQRFTFTTSYLWAGSHRVRVFGTTNDGVPFDLGWTFRVTAP